MKTRNFERREFLKTLGGGLSLVALDWGAFPVRVAGKGKGGDYDVIVVGSGLGGLSCAAAFARQGFKPLVLEQHDRPGGYATSFTRRGGFEFDVSLHSTVVGERDGLYDLIPGFPEITGVEFVPHPELYRVIFPGHDIRVPQKDPESYIRQLGGLFPEEEEGIRGIMEDMRGLRKDIGKLSSGASVDMSRFPVDFPFLFKSYSRTWGELLAMRIRNPKLQAIISAQWAYYGLPPSRLSSFYYALPAIQYLESGGFYTKGRSQSISNALVNFIEEKGGKVMLRTPVVEILVEEGMATGVRTFDGDEFRSRAIVSNASAQDTFRKLVRGSEFLEEYLLRLDKFSVSLSSFQVFLGLKEDLVGRSGITGSEIFVEKGYDMEAGYRAMLDADVENGGYALTLYDNIYKGYSPEGKNTLNIMTLQGFGHWEPFETGYFEGNREEYWKEKERMAGILVRKVEEDLLPGLSGAIEVMEIGTPLTNLRYTGNPRGAIYGYDQTMDNSGRSRLGHSTPVKNLYLSGAWTSPGHGYGGVLGSGLECFAEIMEHLG
ncbi:MAG: NAD(P)/FAD-dependent oxidoreductase [Bacteroidetes bacterium]|nr:MAG: NAD(P)/FAD-dependent oxidoreductase [Bacteroidota bacterium]